MSSGTITARPTQPRSSDSSYDPAVFDLARWKPITPEEYLRDMARIAANVDEDGVDTIKHDLPDGRTRLVLEAETIPSIPGNEGGFTPFLSVLYDPDTDKVAAFRRTDVKLPFDDRGPTVVRGRSDRY